MSKDRWLLPEGIEESLPEESAWLEKYRRELVDMFSTWANLQANRSVNRKNDGRAC